MIGKLTLLLHFFERLLFFCIAPIIPFVLWKGDQISTSQLGLFFMFLFAFYRITPLFLGYLSDLFIQYQSLSIGLIIEILGFIGLLNTNNFALMLLSAVLIGIGGGILGPTILSILEKHNRSAKGDKNLYNWHFMLINAAATIGALSILVDTYIRLTGISMVLVGVSVLIFILRKMPVGEESKKTEGSINNYFFSMISMLTDKKFLKIWLTTVVVWSACSFIYSIIPAKNLTPTYIENVNIWLIINAVSVVIFFYLFRHYGLFKTTCYVNASIGVFLLGLSLIFVAISFNLPSLVLSVILLALGGTISFPQLYGKMADIAPEGKKAQYLGMISVAGALGEGGIQGIFSLYPDPYFLGIALGGGALLGSVVFLYPNFRKPE